ncbi:glutathione S-transferase T3-like [Spinacia oleracea]|uniref:Glutathione S-transferase T3-like n=1 Tax=Spinacia oleracea TaxID=3562 RepID=A0ABM3RP41_SPIOL|nr:glutathione S-transferase T3-like [Spinacia oleracea]
MDPNYYSQNFKNNFDDFDLNSDNNQHPGYDSYSQGNSSSQNFQQSFYANTIVDRAAIEERVMKTQEPIMTHPLPVNPNQPIKVASQSRSWSIQEDEALVDSYIKVCYDQIIGTNIRKADIWRQAAARYSQIQVGRPYELPVRNAKCLESRWGRMSPDIMLWAASFEKAGRLFASGNNDADQVATAHQLFRTENKKNFTLMHAWKMLTKENPKWRVMMRWGMSKTERETYDASLPISTEESDGSGKRTRVDDDGDTVLPSGGSFVSGGISRPDGIKKAKARRKGKGAESSEAVSSFGSRLQANTEVRNNEHELNLKRFEREAEKTIMRRRQLDIEEQRILLDKQKMKHDFLQTLVSKACLTPDEEKVKARLMLEFYSGDN